ncbi:MAG: hypothetical protein QW476_01375 [Candidatus Bathyarchaeia archaeon]|nr:hypothetical protein [Candidatus Bathyarchaeota archaeon]
MKVLLAALFLSLTLSILGIYAYFIEEPKEASVKFWIKENSIIEGKAVRLTWGLKLTPELYYRFKINLEANSTVWVKAIDYPSTKILYAKQTQKLRNEEKIMKVSKGFTELTWLIENKNLNPVTIYQFTVEYENFIKPYETLGKLFITLGLLTSVLTIIKILKTYHGKRQKI